MNNSDFSVLANIPTEILIIFIAVIVWSTIWKGIALWIAARKNMKSWFIALIIINTVGILEIFYIFKISKMSKEINTTNEQ